jgi:hypothetical protein
MLETITEKEYGEQGRDSSLHERVEAASEWLPSHLHRILISLDMPSPLLDAVTLADSQL